MPISCVRLGFCFSVETTKQNNFDNLSSRRCYYRWKMVIGGDNEVAERHQKGIRSTYARVGRFVPSMKMW